MGIMQSAEMDGIVKKKRELKTLNFDETVFVLKEGLNKGTLYLECHSDVFVIQQESMKILLPHLQKFAETGEL